MTARMTTLDCVEMKRQAQRKLNAEFESRKHEFSSYFAFLEAKSRESAWQREFWERVHASRGGER